MTFRSHKKQYLALSLVRESCHIRGVEIGVEYWNFCRILNLCFLFKFQLKKNLQPNLAFLGTFKLLRCLNSKEIKLQSSIRVICNFFSYIKKKTKIQHSTTISTLRIWNDPRIGLRYGLNIGFRRHDSLYENTKLPNHCQISNWKCFCLLLIFDSQWPILNLYLFPMTTKKYWSTMHIKVPKILKYFLFNDCQRQPTMPLGDLY